MNNHSNYDERDGIGQKLKIQGKLPIRTVGIENERERTNYGDLPPQNYLHIWWARRPTPATRLAILGSVLPNTIDDDQLLGWMGINPDNRNPSDSIAEHVRKKKATEDDRDGLLYEHFGYRKSYKNLPDEAEMELLHEVVRDTWGGELPTILDVTSGGGSIPFESVRYEFPTIANELNPVASTILQAVLRHPRVNGDLSDDLQRWGEYIHNLAKDNLDEYFPAPSDFETPANYLWAHEIVCPDCGIELPLAPNWWIEKESGNKGTAVRPTVEDSKVKYEIVELPEDVVKEEFDPTDGTVSYGKGECLNCGVTIDGDEIKKQAQNQEGGLSHTLYAVEYKDYRDDKRGNFRPPTDKDKEIISEVQEKIQSDVELSTVLSDERYVGPADRAANYGITRWRDAFTPRQLLSHYTYWRAFEQAKDQIRSEYSEPEAKAILTFLSFAADKALDYNSKFSSWHSGRTVVRNTFERHDFSYKWTFTEINLTVDEIGYEWMHDSIVEVYEELRELSGHSDAETEVLQGDAASLDLPDKSVEAVIFDPPYYDNVMYAELSDFFYVWMRKYLNDVYPEFFSQPLTEKNEEAVANASEFDEIVNKGQSKKELANRSYENKMTEILEETNRVLDDEGVMTLMFTHKKTEAWDTLTKALIEAGYVVTATHPVSTENPNSLHQAGKNSAESTILLTGEKRLSDPEEYVLWDDIKRKTREVARNRAEELDKSEVEFAKVDIILASFGPTLEVFTENYPVVDDEGNKVSPQKALDEARKAVRDYLTSQYLNEGIKNVDPSTEWYILSWLVFETQRFPYDEARRLAIGIGEDLDSLKKTHRMWRKRSGDVLLRPHGDRVQDINKDRENRSGRKPVDPDALSFATALDKVHAAMHIYDVKGATETWNWMNDRNCGSDPAFKATLEALLRVLPHDHDDWELARDIAAGETGELLDLDLDADIFQDDEEEEEVQGSLDDF